MHYNLQKSEALTVRSNLIICSPSDEVLTLGPAKKKKVKDDREVVDNISANPL
jgi:hypothetical protein